MVKNPPANARYKKQGFSPWVEKIPWRRAWQPTSVSLPGEFHGQRSLEGYSPRGRKESTTTERFHFYFHTLPNQNVVLKISLWRNSGALNIQGFKRAQMS